MWRSDDRPLRLASLWLTESYDTGDGVIAHLGPGPGGEATLSVPVHAETVPCPEIRFRALSWDFAT
jgi:hypothetical protein